MSLSHPFARAGIVVAVLAGLLTLGIGSASAHVTVSSADASPGGYGKVIFRVPNESDTASTVSLRIQLPTDAPFTSVRTEPMAGWTATATRTQLNPPLSDGHGGQVTSAVSVVEFTAAPGAGIGPGQFQEFALSLGRFPEVKSLTFNAVQTYSDGTEAAWIEPRVAGQPEPGYPAPQLTFVADSTGASTDSAAGDSAAGNEDNDGGTSWPAWLALGVAGVALLVAVGGVVQGRPRRTVSS